MNVHHSTSSTPHRSGGSHISTVNTPRDSQRIPTSAAPHSGTAARTGDSVKFGNGERHEEGASRSHLSALAANFSSPGSEGLTGAARDLPDRPKALEVPKLPENTEKGETVRIPKVSGDVPSAGTIQIPKAGDGEQGGEATQPAAPGVPEDGAQPPPPDAPAAEDNAKAPQAPSFEEIRKQKLVMEAGMEGGSVEALQKRLSALGYKTEATGRFDEKTEEALKKFQGGHDVGKTGRFGPQSLEALEKAEKTPRYDPELGRRIAGSAQSSADSRCTTGNCYAGVADALDRHGIVLSGNDAYMAANQLARHPKVSETRVKASELSSLPAGAIVVWGKTDASPSGHISVADGKGNEMSDHTQPQLTSLRGYTNYRVFLPAR